MVRVCRVHAFLLRYLCLCLFTRVLTATDGLHACLCVYYNVYVCFSVCVCVYAQGAIENIAVFVGLSWPVLPLLCMGRKYRHGEPKVHTHSQSVSQSSSFCQGSA